MEHYGWKRVSDALLGALVDDLWKGDRFVGLRRPDGKEIDCRSLITCMPVILGNRLPAAVQKALAKRIRTFMTPHGLATEHPDSPEFLVQKHAYWRSSVWPPPVMIAVSGLMDSGETALAQRIARRYCRATAKCFFRENHDPLTGEGRSDVSYTWASSVYLILAHEYV